jgi:hypothetical protein
MDAIDDTQSHIDMIISIKPISTCLASVIPPRVLIFSTFLKYKTCILRKISGSATSDKVNSDLFFYFSPHNSTSKINERSKNLLRQRPDQYQQR